MAHELNNLLQPVRGMTEIMLADLAEGRPPERADLETVEACAIQAVGVIQGILGYVPARDDRAPAPGLRAAVATACTFIRPMLREPFAVAIRDRGHRGPGPPGRADPDLLNLLQNAVQAGATRMRVEVDRIDGDRAAGGARPRMRLRVIDDGQGMSAAVAARALDPYFTTKATGQGTGLGLAIVRSIVVGWSGDLQLTSEPGAEPPSPCCCRSMPADAIRAGAVSPRRDCAFGNRSTALHRNPDRRRRMG